VTEFRKKYPNNTDTVNTIEALYKKYYKK